MFLNSDTFNLTLATMARVCLLFVIFTFNIAFILCNDENSNCDMCIRAGNRWCNDIGSEHCESEPTDNWCLSSKEMLKINEPKTTKGSFLTVTSAESTVLVGQEYRHKIAYEKLTKKSGNSKFKVTTVNTTQTNEIEVISDQDCVGTKCTISVTVKPLSNFCLSTGTKDEFFHVKLTIEDIKEEALLKFHVPCQCGCSLIVEENSKSCNGNGNFSCGICTCKPKWTGVKCDSQVYYDYPQSNQVTAPNCIGDSSNCGSTSRPGLTAINVEVEGSSERTLLTDIPDILKINHNAPDAERHFEIIKTTENENIKINEIFTKCDNKNLFPCYTIYEVEVGEDFCSATSEAEEYVTVQYYFDSTEVLVKYVIPCKPPCELVVERKSAKCNYKGDLSCGVCSCQNEWTGDYCDKHACGARRGDVQCNGNDDTKTKVECYGNGYCGKCDSCICYTDRIGYQYFDEKNYCSDICRTTFDVFDDCLYENIPGSCTTNFDNSLTILPYREERLEKRDSLNRTVWISCNITVSDCYIEYVTMMADSGDMYAMVVRNCNTAVAGTVTIDSRLPIIFGILGLVAAVAAVGGFMMWKHMNSGPPMQLSDPEYTNIDAEDNTGENPLYKPPTSSFKNPTYGKW